MLPHRKYGQIEFAGEWWRWMAVAHSVVAHGAGNDTSGLRWVVCFRRLPGGDRRMSCELPWGNGEGLRDRRLLNRLEEASAVQEGRSLSHR